MKLLLIVLVAIRAKGHVFDESKLDDTRTGEVYIETLRKQAESTSTSSITSFKFVAIVVGCLVAVAVGA